MTHMNTLTKRLTLLAVTALFVIRLVRAENDDNITISTASAWSEKAPRVPRFSVDYMDPNIGPGMDFYHYADGAWLKNNPVPADKSRWGAFAELQERNWYLIHGILNETLTRPAESNSPVQQVADFFRSAMNTNRLEELGFKPLDPDLKRIAD